MLSRLLDRLGCFPVVAHDGARARELCESRPRFVLGIIDLALPREDGPAVLPDLQALLGDRAPAFALFMSSPPSTRPEGVVAIVEKPSRLGQLVAAVKAAVSESTRREHSSSPRSATREITETYATQARPTAAPPPLDTPPATDARSSGTRRSPSPVAPPEPIDDVARPRRGDGNAE